MCVCAGVLKQQLLPPSLDEPMFHLRHSSFKSARSSPGNDDSWLWDLEPAETGVTSIQKNIDSRPARLIQRRAKAKKKETRFRLFPNEILGYFFFFFSGFVRAAHSARH